MLKYLKDKAEDLKWWYEAMHEAVDHLIRGHNVRLRTDLELWAGHTGCTVCKACPDHDGRDYLIWCRHSWTVAWLGQRLCGLIGHPLFQHPRGINGYIEEDLYCYRCTAESKLRKEWPEESLLWAGRDETNCSPRSSASCEQN